MFFLHATALTLSHRQLYSSLANIRDMDSSNVEQLCLDFTLPGRRNRWTNRWTNRGSPISCNPSLFHAVEAVEKGVLEELKQANRQP